MDRESGTFIYTYTMKYCLAIKRNEILPFVTRMNLEGIMLSEVSDNDRQMIYDFTYMWNLKKKKKNKTMNKQ